MSVVGGTYLGGGHVLEGNPAADQLAGHDAQAVDVWLHVVAVQVLQPTKQNVNQLRQITLQCAIEWLWVRPDLAQQLGAEPGQQGRAVVRHVEHGPHPPAVPHHVVDAVQPRQVDPALARQQDVTGFHPPERRDTQRNT